MYERDSERLKYLKGSFLSPRLDTVHSLDGHNKLTVYGCIVN